MKRRDVPTPSGEVEKVRVAICSYTCACGLGELSGEERQVGREPVDVSERGGRAVIWDAPFVSKFSIIVLSVEYCPDVKEYSQHEESLPLQSLL